MYVLLVRCVRYNIMFPLFQVQLPKFLLKLYFVLKKKCFPNFQINKYDDDKALRGH